MAPSDLDVHDLANPQVSHDLQDNPDSLLLVPHKTFAADGSGGDFYGYSVALSQDLAVVDDHATRRTRDPWIGLHDRARAVLDPWSFRSLGEVEPK